MPDPATPRTHVRVTLSANTIFRILAVAALALGLIGFGANVANSRDGSDLVWPFARQFDFGEEGNFVNWYQSVTLFACALLLVIIALAKRRAGAPRVLHWVVLAAVVAFVAIDEAAQIHDRTVNAFIAALTSTAADKAAAPRDSGIFGSTWMFVYLPVGLVLTLVYLRFFFALPRKTRWGLAISAALYLGGAVVVEAIYERVSAADGGETAISFALDACSETFEMLGVAVFAGTLVAYLAREVGGMSVQFSEGKFGDRVHEFPGDA